MFHVSRCASGHPVYAALREEFECGQLSTVKLCFPDRHEQVVSIQQFTDVEMLIEGLVKKLNSDHTAIDLYFDCYISDRFTSDEKVNAKMASFQKFAAEEPIQFSISEYKNRTIIVQPKIMKSEDLGEGKIRKTYFNNTVEEVFFSDRYDWEGVRVFSNGKKEKGRFNKESLRLLSGYQREPDGKIECINPKSFASYIKESKKEHFSICDVEGNLVVVEKKQDDSYKTNYIITEIPVETILLKASQRSFYGDGKSIKDVLLHRSFKERKENFLKLLMDPDERGTPPLFTFSNFAALDVVEMASQDVGFNPLKIVDSVSGRNFLIQAAYWGSKELLNKMIELFPQESLSVSEGLIATLLTERHSDLVYGIDKKLKNLRKVFDIP